MPASFLKSRSYWTRAFSGVKLLSCREPTGADSHLEIRSELSHGFLGRLSRG